MNKKFNGHRNKNRAIVLFFTVIILNNNIGHRIVGLNDSLQGNDYGFTSFLSVVMLDYMHYLAGGEYAAF